MVCETPVSRDCGGLVAMVEVFSRKKIGNRRRRGGERHANTRRTLTVRRTAGQTFGPRGLSKKTVPQTRFFFLGVQGPSKNGRLWTTSTWTSLLAIIFSSSPIPFPYSTATVNRRRVHHKAIRRGLWSPLGHNLLNEVSRHHRLHQPKEWWKTRC